MGQVFLPGNPPIGITLRHSARARRMSLRVSAMDGRVTLTLPRGVAETTGIDFAREKAEWLRTQLAKQPETVRVRGGIHIPVEGHLLRLAPGSGRRIVADDECLYVPGPDAAVAGRVQGWLKARARDRLAGASDRHALALGRAFSRLALRDTRSRWGSCSHDGGLMYSWRLIMCPPDVLDYVAAHEVAHLAEMNHSPAFWSVVAQLCPGYDRPRRWLRQNGAGLHRYRFED